MCEDGVASLLADNKSKNLGDEYNIIDFLDQFEVLDNHHIDYYDSIIVQDNIFPSTPIDILVPPEDVDLKILDMEFDLAEEIIIIETSSSSHYLFFSLICNASTCN